MCSRQDCGLARTNLNYSLQGFEVNWSGAVQERRFETSSDPYSWTCDDTSLSPLFEPLWICTQHYKTVIIQWFPLHWSGTTAPPASIKVGASARSFNLAMLRRDLLTMLRFALPNVAGFSVTRSFTNTSFFVHNTYIDQQIYRFVRGAYQEGWLFTRLFAPHWRGIWGWEMRKNGYCFCGFCWGDVRWKDWNGTEEGSMSRWNSVLKKRVKITSSKTLTSNHLA